MYAQLDMVVQFAVEDDLVASAGRGHGLMALGREVQNGQPPMGQGQAQLRVGPDPAVVRSAVVQTRGHGLGPGLQGVSILEIAEESCDAAHALLDYL